MRLANVNIANEEQAAIIHNKKVYLLKDIKTIFNYSGESNVFSLISSGQLNSLINEFNNDKDKLKNIDSIPINEIVFEPLYRHPNKIIGIGLNYVDHASDLSEKAPADEPASFMKPNTTIIGHNDTLKIPYQSKRTTAEAELGIIIGKECKNVTEKEALDFVAGYTTIIDGTAEDILEKNPRFLTRAKSFDTFFSFGPELITVDEIESLEKLEVATILNGKTYRKNFISNMTFDPAFLISFYSKVMTLEPGDIISTGTPGATVIKEGDVVSCEISGFSPLINIVKDLKK